ncbi:hypothetical protein O988_08834 [Pseudogymnoascus sp. VKM F-3808]|nr:hypothetical protein O988_08834 [Pseudogymnoascus sp. VKM F-3808]
MGAATITEVPAAPAAPPLASRLSPFAGVVSHCENSPCFGVEQQFYGFPREEQRGNKLGYTHLQISGICALVLFDLHICSATSEWLATEAESSNPRGGLLIRRRASPCSGFLHQPPARTINLLQTFKPNVFSRKVPSAKMGAATITEVPTAPLVVAPGVKNNVISLLSPLAKNGIPSLVKQPSTISSHKVAS